MLDTINMKYKTAQCPLNLSGATVRVSLDLLSSSGSYTDSLNVSVQRKACATSDATPMDDTEAYSTNTLFVLDVHFLGLLHKILRSPKFSSCHPILRLFTISLTTASSSNCIASNNGMINEK
jgi:hypothetical protein